MDECAGEISSDGICQYSERALTWEDARLYCQGLGGDILTPETEEDFDLIGSLQTDLWIGVSFFAEEWRLISTNQTVDDNLSDWVYGQGRISILS